jgi:molybdate transport system ATP-binding protein
MWISIGMSLLLQHPATAVTKAVTTTAVAATTTMTVTTSVVKGTSTKVWTNKSLLLRQYRLQLQLQLQPQFPLHIRSYTTTRPRRSGGYNNHKKNPNTISSYGPLLKQEGPSSRKVWRNEHVYAEMLYRRRKEEEQEQQQQELEEHKRKATASARGEEYETPPPWLIRIQQAQMQYPIHRDNNTDTNRTTSKITRDSKRKASHIGRSQEEARRNMMFLTMNKFEIRPNTIMVHQRSTRERTKGTTGHVILGLNGSGKSLLVQTILYQYHQQHQQQQQQQQQHQNSNSSCSSGTVNTCDLRSNHIPSPPLTARNSSITDTIEMNDTHEVEVVDDRNGSATTARRNDTDAMKQEPTAAMSQTTTNPYLHDTNTLQFQSPHTNQPLLISYVSFESHQELIDVANTEIERGGCMTVNSVLTQPMGGGHLTKGMQYLVVRFGLYPFLSRDVTTLSTGEIRKVLLIRALSQQPHILLLDNAYDGLDAPSRKIVHDIVYKTLNGFQKADILVQGVNVKTVVSKHGTTPTNNTVATQVVVLTHRYDEINDVISRVTFMQHPSTGLPSTTEKRSDRTAKELLFECAGVEPLELGLLTPQQFARKADHMRGLHDRPWYDTTLPTDDEITDVWWDQSESGGANPSRLTSSDSGREIIRARYLDIKSAKDDTKYLISGLNWKVKYGERWWLSGLNGAGKSTLSKFLVTTAIGSKPTVPESTVSQSMNNDGDDESILQLSLASNAINYISTERHMSLSKSHDITRDVLLSLGLQTTTKGNKRQSNKAPSPDATIKHIMKWLNVPKPLLTRPFNQLSQGEQKMMLIAGVLSFCPSLLILDEPLQGLDIVNRHRVLGVVERICAVTDISLIYVTHHYEDLIPSLTHVLHLVDGKSTFKGTVETFDCHNTLWSDKLKSNPMDVKSLGDTEKNYDTKKKRKRRLW